jgi:hypothetical protein
MSNVRTKLSDKITMRVEWIKYRCKKAGIDVIDVRSGEGRDFDLGFCYLYKNKLHIGITTLHDHDLFILDLENAIKFYEHHRYRLNHLFFIVVDFLIEYRDDYDIKISKSFLKHWRYIFRRDGTSEESICAFNDILLMLIKKGIIPKMFKL